MHRERTARIQLLQNTARLAPSQEITEIPERPAEGMLHRIEPRLEAPRRHRIMLPHLPAVTVEAAVAVEIHAVAAAVDVKTLERIKRHRYL